MTHTRLETARIRAARQVIDPIFLNTPLYRCEALEPHLGCTISIKLETANPVRSFKGCGTEHLANNLADIGTRAVVCASAGNLGQPWPGPATNRTRDRCTVPFFTAKPPRKTEPRCRP